MTELERRLPGIMNHRLRNSIKDLVKSNDQKSSIITSDGRHKIKYEKGAIVITNANSAEKHVRSLSRKRNIGELKKRVKKGGPGSLAALKLLKELEEGKK